MKNEPIHPIRESWVSNNASVQPPTSGLTKLEHFAGLAMQGMLANPYTMKDFNEHTEDAEKMLKLVSKVSLCSAKELIKQLEKEPK